MINLVVCMTETEALHAFRHVITGKKSQASFQVLSLLLEFTARTCGSLLLRAEIVNRYC